MGCSKIKIQKNRSSICKINNFNFIINKKKIKIKKINDIDLLYSENMYPNRKNGFECDFVDIN